MNCNGSAIPRMPKFFRGFLKTGKGEYGEGDVFRGIKIPALRKLAKKYQDITCAEVQELLTSKFHEDRMLALLLLMEKYSKPMMPVKKQIYIMYLRNTRFINNWDLVDVTVITSWATISWIKTRSPYTVWLGQKCSGSGVLHHRNLSLHQAKQV